MSLLPFSNFWRTKLHTRPSLSDPGCYRAMFPDNALLSPNIRDRDVMKILFIFEMRSPRRFPYPHLFTA